MQKRKVGYGTGQSLRATLIVTALLLLAAAGLRPAAPALAACGSPTVVTTQAELNDAIDDFNGEAGPCAYEIEFGADITQTNDLSAINNSNAGVSLLIDGAGFTLDGDFFGDGFFILDTEDVTFDRITIINNGNDAIAAENSGLRVSRSTFQDGSSDGIQAFNTDLVVVDSTFVGNGSNGLDMSSDSPATATVINSTITGGDNEVIFWDGPTGTLTHVTVSNNAAGIFIAAGDVTINNSIFANDGVNCFLNGGTIDINFSLLSSTDDACGATDGVDGNIVGEDPLLGFLGDYGGPTPTIPLVTFTGDVTATSPAVNAGSDALSVDETDTTLAFDQRGTGFPRDVGGTVDMGAFEGTVEIACSISTAQLVGDETELNEAILCFNKVTTAGDYTIEFDADITLTTDLIEIDNPTAGITLLIDGAGFTLDGDDVADTIVTVGTPDVTIDHLTVAGSTEDGIQAGLGDLRVSRSTIRDNDSNGIDFFEGDLVVVDSTIMGNNGSGLAAFGDEGDTTVTVINSTFTTNEGEAIIVFDTITLLTHVTVYNNNAGLVIESDADVTVNNSILAGNGEDCLNFFGTIDVNFSLVQNDFPEDPCGVTDGVDGNIVGQDPLLGALADNGGPTLTFAPLEFTGGVSAISPVVDAGSDALSVDETDTTLAFDQRGTGFPRDVGGTVDMGAVEGTEVITCPAFPTTATDEDELSDAILCYNVSTTPGVYVINLGDDIDLTTSLPAISNDTAGISLVIEGGGNTIDGQDTLGVRPMAVAITTTVTLNGATITGGNVEGDGGGIHNQGDLTLNNVAVQGNAVDNDGGGVFNADGAVMEINDSLIEANEAVYPDGDGGGITNDGTMTITRSVITGNEANGDSLVIGGGILAEAYLTLIDSTVSGNSANAEEEEAYGGGVANQATLIIRNSTVSGNFATADFFTAYGGGIYSEVGGEEFFEEGKEGRLAIINSTISENSAASDEDVFGGGLFVTDLTDDCCLDDPIPVSIINTTISDNSAATTTNIDIGGGGAYFTISNSDGVGMNVTIDNSIMANSTTQGAAGGDCGIGEADDLTFDSNFSLYEDTGVEACDVVNGVDGNIVGVDPALGSLTDNGGPTDTHLPGGTSDAIDSGDNALAVDENGDPLTADQRGFVPRIFGGTVDMGSVEVGAEGPGGGGDIFMSTTAAGTTGDGLAFGPEDVIRWDGEEWSLWFDGSAAGLTPMNAKHNLNAIYIPDPGGDDLLLSFAQNARVVPGIAGKVDGMDLVLWDGAAFSLWFDGQDVGLTVLTSEKIDALHVLPGSESPIGSSCDAYLLVSTSGPGKVPNHSGGTLNFGGEDVLGFCATSLGAATAGKWHKFLDGSNEGMPKNSTDSISLSDDGNTLYLTTKGTFVVDDAVGGHSMIYEYDLTTTEFSGPTFIAADNGLPKKVDGLHVE